MRGEIMHDKKIFSTNNFNLIRLFAALQVVFYHTSYHLNIQYTVGGIYSFVNSMPGVPIFFFISGYLISKSYEKNSVINEYAINRLLRIYPALLICVLLSVFSVYAIGYMDSINESSIDMVIWVLSQISIFQFYNPDFMRDYGSGVLNGSLWTITVELQFYIVVPVLYFFLNKLKSFNINMILVVIMCFFIVLNRIYFIFYDDYKDFLLFKIIGVSFLPWFYMFLTGVLFQRNFKVIYDYLSGKFIYVGLFYLVYALLVGDLFEASFGNSINPLVFFPLSILVFSAAYTSSNLSNIVLKSNDVSYGVYIYHMPIVNGFMYLGLTQDIQVGFSVILLTLLCAFLSWKIIEYPSLQLKKHPLNPFLSKN